MRMEKKYKTISTKIPIDVAMRIERIAREKGTSRYGLLQMALNGIVRFLDKEHDITDEMALAICAFEWRDEWKDAIKITDPSVEKTIDEAVYFIRSRDGTKHGRICVMVWDDDDGKFRETANVDEILDTVIRHLLPSTRKSIRSLMRHDGSTSVAATLMKLAHERMLAILSDELREEFEDNERSVYGTKPHEHKYKKKHRKGIDQMDKGG